MTFFVFIAIIIVILINEKHKSNFNLKEGIDLMHFPEDELISAFHKELRAYNPLNACYFAQCLKNQVGAWKLKQYLFFVCFEETVNLNLFSEIERLFSMEDETISEKDFFRVIYSFLKSKKKWDTTYGQEFCFRHMEAKKKVGDDLEASSRRYVASDLTYEGWVSKLQVEKICYSTKMKKFKETGTYNMAEMFSILDEAISEKNMDKAVYMAITLFNHKDKLPFDSLEELMKNDYSKSLFKIMQKYKGKYSYVYNYILLFFCQITDIPSEELQFISENDLEKIVNDIYKLQMNTETIPIPPYALDKHTRRGKALLEANGIRLNRQMKNIDLRLSGNIIGVYWRIQAINQFSTIQVDWESVIFDKKLLDGSRLEYLIDDSKKKSFERFTF